MESVCWKMGCACCREQPSCLDLEIPVTYQTATSGASSARVKPHWWIIYESEVCFWSTGAEK
jgi:hypothetical protein